MAALIAECKMEALIKHTLYQGTAHGFTIITKQMIEKMFKAKDRKLMEVG